MSTKCEEKNCERRHYARGWCKLHYDQWYHKEHKDVINNQIEKRRAKIPGYYRNKHLKSTFGITLEEYNLMHKSQGGKCKLCRRKETKVINAKNGKPHNLAVDHCHKTNKIRGLLCAACNTAIGHFQDNPELLRRTADYLDTHS